jgi:hypothetical protein
MNAYADKIRDIIFDEKRFELQVKKMRLDELTLKDMQDGKIDFDPKSGKFVEMVLVKSVKVPKYFFK